MRPSVSVSKAVEVAASEFGLGGATILVAVSGGPDSLALLHALVAAKNRTVIDGIAVAHFDHGLRGEESAAEAAFVADYCHTNGVPCRLGAAGSGSIAGSSRGSLQEAAREARYAFLDRTADDMGARFIATAHNRDDQIETVLINILRGTGIDGLRGIPRRNGRYIRPLLNVDRPTIEAYCAEHGLTPRRDPSNDDPAHYLRNRVRLELLPLLERDYHPSVRDSLLRLSDNAAIDSAYLDEIARDAFTSVSASYRGMGVPPVSNVFLDAAALTALPHAIRRRVVRLAVERVRGTREGLTESHVELALDLAAGNPGAIGFTIPTPPCRVLLHDGRLTFEIPPATDSTTPYSIPLAIPSAIDLDNGWTISVSLAPFEGVDEAHTATMDAGKIDLSTLVIRSRVDGDRIDPLGMGGKTKKLQDVFVDGKIPKRERDSWPIVADIYGVVWIPGLTQSERAKVREATAQVLYLTAIQWLRRGDSSGEQTKS